MHSYTDLSCESINIPSSNDMATMTKLVKPFRGQPDEDALVWLTTFIVIADANDVSIARRPKIFICCLQDAALQWAAETITNHPDLTIDEILEMFKTRFSGTMGIEKAFSRLTQLSEIRNQSDIVAAIRDANILIKAKYISLDCLKGIFASRLPSNFKPIIRQAVPMTRSWQEFSKFLEENILPSLSGASSQPQTGLTAELYQACPTQTSYPKPSFYGKQRFSTRPQTSSKTSFGKRCPLHGPGHSQQECYTFKQLRDQGYNFSRQSSVASVCETPEEHIDLGIDETNKSDKPYRSLTYTTGACMATTPNLFRRQGNVQGKQVPVLIDTGADTSIINYDLITPNKLAITPSAARATSACGGKLNIVGSCPNISLSIDNTNYNIQGLVTRGKPDYIIIGADSIAKYPSLVTNRLNTLSPATQNTQAITIHSIPQTTSLSMLLSKYTSIFQQEVQQHVKCNLGCHRIDLTQTRPINAGNSRIPVAYEQAIEEEIQKNLRLGIISESNSEWSSRIVPVDKKDGTLRMCIDFRPLNKITRRDQYPIPRTDDIFDALGKARIFSTLDATSGFYQVEILPEDRCKTAFSWKGGFYEFNRMPFGLCNAPATFQRIMDRIFRKERSFVLPYFDDIIVFSESIEDHTRHLEETLAMLEEAGITLNKKKCVFAKSEVSILGFIVGHGQIKPDPAKVQALQDYRKPNDISELRAFLGLVNYNREFIDNFAITTQPLYDIFKGEQRKSTKTIIWDEKRTKAFEALRGAVKESTSRALPNFDQEFIVITDASKVAIGGILAQRDEHGTEQIVHVFSKALDSAQKNYSVTDLELLAVVKSLEQFRHYILGRRFKLRTDHRSLLFLQECKSPTSRQLRYALKLQDYDYNIEHIRGEDNPADSISRYIGAVQLRPADDPLSKEQQSQILSEYHQALGHGSSNAMKHAIQQKYKWEGMYKDIDSFTQNCQLCLKGGYELRRRGNRALATHRPNELWEIDIMGYLDETKRGNKYIFVAIDHYSKWIEAAAIKAKDKEAICRLVKSLIIDKHGAPQTILSDNGLEFNNSLLRQLLSDYNIQHVFCSPAHHETTGAVERVNQTLLNKLKKICDFGRKPWDIHLATATRGVNLSYSRAIFSSPYMLLQGKLPDLPIDLKLGKSNITIDSESLHRTIKDKSPEYRKISIQGPVAPKESTIKIGDHVLIYKKQLGRKLANNWVPGFIVTEKIPPDAYKVKNQKGSYRLNKHHIKKDFSKGGVVSL
ncbi:hypothetical protein PAPHI01_1237 [Pancytospora philotis]|nr:hypothetical protein PAPHI01_1237 [Pancytospora philotis]